MKKVIGLCLFLMLLAGGCTFGTNPDTGRPTIKTNCAVCKLVWTGMGYEYVCEPQDPNDPSTHKNDGNLSNIPNIP